MPGLRDLLNKKEQWDQQEAQFAGGNNYFPRQGDKVYFYFGWSGLPEGDDPWADLFEAFITHEIPAAETGTKYASQRYCPVESGHDENYDCALCKDDYNTKKRMRMYMWIGQMLRTQSKENDPQTEQIMWQGRMYNKWEINDWKIWDTSAWRDSCLQDILLNADGYAQAGQSLHATMFQLEATGEGLNRRYKLSHVPGSPEMPDHLKEEAKQLEPIRTLLRKEIETVPTQTRPTGEAPKETFDPTAGITGSVAPNNMVADEAPAPPETPPQTPPAPPEQPPKPDTSSTQMPDTSTSIDTKKLY